MRVGKRTRGKTGLRGLSSITPVTQGRRERASVLSGVKAAADKVVDAERSALLASPA